MRVYFLVIFRVLPTFFDYAKIEPGRAMWRLYSKVQSCTSRYSHGHGSTWCYMHLWYNFLVQIWLYRVLECCHNSMSFKKAFIQPLNQPLDHMRNSSQLSRYFVAIFKIFCRNFKIFPLQKSQGVWSPLAQHTWNKKTWWWKWRINDKDGIRIEYW